MQIYLFLFSILSLQKDNIISTALCTFLFHLPYPTAHPPSFLRDVCVLVTQSCPILRDPMDCSPPGSSVHGSLQARILELAAIPFSRGSSWTRDQTWVSELQAGSLPSELPGKPVLYDKKYMNLVQISGTELLKPLDFLSDENF